MRFLALSCALTFVVVSASADETRYPASGMPAVTVKIPDGWSGKEEGGKFKASAADGSATVTISIVPYAGSMDALAAETFQAEQIDPSTDRHAALVADMYGYWWPSQQPAAGGKTRKVFFCDVMLGDGKALTGLLVSSEDDSPGYHAGLSMLDRMKVVRE